MPKLRLTALIAVVLLSSPGGTPAAARSSPRTQVMILGVSHLVARHDVHNAVFQDDPLSAKRQSEIADIVQRLSRFNPTKVLIEAPMGDPVFATRYRQFLAGRFELRADEIYQFGFRLAARAGDGTIFPIDTPAKSY